MRRATLALSTSPYLLWLAGCAAAAPDTGVTPTGDEESPQAEAPPASDIHLLPLRTVDGRVQIAGPHVTVTDRAGYDNQPAFTADSRAILYTSIRDGQADTYRYDLDSGSIARVTRTPESEYSPTPVPGTERFSVVRVEADGTQRLWSFALDGSDPRLVLPDIEPVGYHAWADPGTVALFILGEPPTLQLAAPGPGVGSVVAADIGRAIQPVPGRVAVTFTQRLDDDWWLQLHEPGSGDTRSLARLLEPDAYHAHTPDGGILGAHGTRIHQLADRRWVEVTDLGDRGLGTLSRLAVSPDGAWLAVVADRPASGS
jgi:hypothetical protein